MPGVSEHRRTQRVGWLDVAEVGGAFGIRFFVIVCTALGRAPARICLRLVALYYMLFHATARRASRDWLARIHGSEHVTRRMVYDHLLRFSHVALDRLFFVRRQIWRFETRVLTEQVFRTIRARKQGVVFLGAHVGSFEAIRVLAALKEFVAIDQYPGAALWTELWKRVGESNFGVCARAVHI